MSISHAMSTNILEVVMMLSFHDTHIALTSYDNSKTNAFIRNDINPSFPIRSPDAILSQTGLFSRFFDN